MKIAIGSDHAGLELKEHLINYLKTRGIEYLDFGVGKDERGDYPVYGEIVANAVVSGNYDKGLLICGTGVGISIAANKVPGIRAVVCSEPYSAKLSREHNDTNILAMGQRVVGSELAIMILEVWLEATPEGGRHQGRIDQISEIEQKHQK